jgi:hypothetical protein
MAKVNMKGATLQAFGRNKICKRSERENGLRLQKVSIM